MKVKNPTVWLVCIGHGSANACGASIQVEFTLISGKLEDEWRNRMERKG